MLEGDVKPQVYNIHFCAKPARGKYSQLLANDWTSKPPFAHNWCGRVESHLRRAKTAKLYYITCLENFFISCWVQCIWTSHVLGGTVWTWISPLPKLHRDAGVGMGMGPAVCWQPWVKFLQWLKLWGHQSFLSHYNCGKCYLCKVWPA